MLNEPVLEIPFTRDVFTLERERHLNNVFNNPPPISSNIVHPAVDFESLQTSISTISVVRRQRTLAQATAPADIPQSLDISLPQSNLMDWWVALSRSIPRLRTMTNEWREVEHTSYEWRNHSGAVSVIQLYSHPSPHCLIASLDMFVTTDLSPAHIVGY